MVEKTAKNGLKYNEPPYTFEEEQRLYKAMTGVATFYWPTPKQPKAVDATATKAAPPTKGRKS